MGSRSEGLARLLMASVSDVQFDQNDENELISLIKNGDEKQLAMWLNFHSFTKWQIQSVADKCHYQSGDESPAVFEENLKADVRKIIQDYLQDSMLKNNNKKYQKEDIDDHHDYFALTETLKFLNMMIYQDGRDQKKLIRSQVQILVNAKNRRNEILKRNFNGVCIAPPPDDDDEDEGKSENEKENEKVDLLLDEMVKTKIGERKQVFYHYKDGGHVFSFDLERGSDNKLRIFCFESAADSSPVLTLNLLCHKLATERKEAFQIKSCISKMQRDGFNCTVYSLSVMNELSKYPHVYDYLPNDAALKPIDKDEIIRVANEISDKAGRDHITVTPQFDDVKWVALSDMPVKVIAMSQSYTEMKENLEASPNFDLNSDEFIEKHKKKYKFEPAKPDEKYINRRRKHIGERVIGVIPAIREDQYQVELQRHPLLQALEAKQKLNVGNVEEFIVDMSTEDKLQYIKNIFNIILARHDQASKYASMDKTIPDLHIHALLALRECYLQVMTSELDKEKAIKIVKDFRSLMMRYNLDQYLDYYPLIDRTGLEEKIDALCGKISVEKLKKMEDLVPDFMRNGVSKYLNENKVDEATSIEQKEETNPKAVPTSGMNRGVVYSIAAIVDLEVKRLGGRVSGVFRKQQDIVSIPQAVAEVIVIRANASLKPDPVTQTWIEKLEVRSFLEKLRNSILLRVLRAPMKSEKGFLSTLFGSKQPSFHPKEYEIASEILNDIGKGFEIDAKSAALVMKVCSKDWDDQLKDLPATHSYLRLKNHIANIAKLSNTPMFGNGK